MDETEWTIEQKLEQYEELKRLFGVYSIALTAQAASEPDKEDAKYADFAGCILNNIRDRMNTFFDAQEAELESTDKAVN